VAREACDEPGKAVIAEVYGRGAESYAAVLDPTLRPLIERRIDRADLAPGRSVLDLATGTGAVARAAAACGATVVGADIARPMVALARRLSGKSIDFVAADAAALPLTAASFDVVTLGLSLSHLVDRPASLAEVVRVLRPGGRLVASSWAGGKANPAFSAILDVLRRHASGPVHPFAELLDESTWSNTESGRAVLHDAGFAPVHVTTDTMSAKYASPDDAVAWAFAWPSYGNTVRDLDEATRASVYREAVATLRKMDGLGWTASFHCYVATKSGH